MKRSALFISLVLTLLACARIEEVTTPAPEYQPQELIITAYGGDDDVNTKTTRQANTDVYWSPGDAISLFFRSGENGGSKFVAQNTEEVAITQFKGTIDVISGGGEDTGGEFWFWGIYPYSTENSCDGSSITTVIPAQQTGKAGTFADNTFITMARAKGLELGFYNICSGIKFTLTRDDVREVRIRGNNNENIAGKIKAEWDANGKPAIKEYVEGVKEVSVTAPDGGYFAMDTEYYLVFAPELFTNGFTLTLITDLWMGDFVYGSERQFKRSIFTTIPGLDTRVTWRPYRAAIGNVLPDGIDKTTITEAYFHVLSDKTTATELPSDYYSTAVYFELDGTVAHYYTPGYSYSTDNAQFWFSGWTNLRKLDLSNFDFRYTTDFEYMFEGCISLEDLDLGSFENSVATRVFWMFKNCRKLKSIDLSNFHSDKITSTRDMFQYCMSLTSLNLSGFITDNVTDMSEMFEGCKSMESFDLSSFNTSKVTNMSSMFAGCSSLTEIDLSTFDMANVEDISNMFGQSAFGTGNGSSLEGCSSLKSIDLSSWDTSNLSNVGAMFSCANSLTSVNLSGWITANITNTVRIFEYCTSLKSLDLSGFAPANLEYGDAMFNGCINLESLNISGLASSNISSASELLFNCGKLNKLDLGDMDLSIIGDLNRFLAGTAYARDRIAIRCNAVSKDIISQEASSSSFDLNKVIWVGLDESMPEVSDDIRPGWYYSTDYSKDKTVEILQEASVGAGVDIVIFGDAYSDRLIADGTYENDIRTAIDGLFSYEPMKTFRNMFNVYMVYAVSTNEVYNGDTAVGIQYGGTGSQLKTFNYAKCVAKGKTLSDVTLIVVGHDTDPFVNSGCLGKTVTSSGGSDINDYGNAVWSCAYVSRSANDQEFANTVAHEFGHTFAKLADEYISKPGLSVNDNYRKDNLQYAMDDYGFYKNIDFTNNPSLIKWSRFISDDRYSSENLGAYEGATYDSDVWRPDENSIMRYGDRFNAPSREAIYYRIHKLAYGSNWQYDYETFVQQDLKNIPVALVPAPAKRALSSVKTNRKHFFEMEESIAPDGRKIVTVIMD